jgi:hypothetical protein
VVGRHPRNGIWPEGLSWSLIWTEALSCRDGSSRTRPTSYFGLLGESSDRAERSILGGASSGLPRLLLYRRTSATRVVVVCLFAQLPAFVVAILVECIPLGSPSESWKANYMFWIRLYVSSLPIAVGGVCQVKEVIQPGVITSTGIAATACYVALTMAVAALWKFPIPFGYVLTVGPFVAFYTIFLLASIGPRALARSPLLRQQIAAQMLVIAAQGTLAICYPTFGAVFNQLSGHEQTAFIFVLLILKFCIKQFVAKASTNMHEHIGPTVVLSVDLCNVLYVAICVQTAISPVTTTLMIATDAFFVVLAFRSIYQQTNLMQARLASTLTQLQGKNDFLQNLVALIRCAFQTSRAMGGLSPPIRIRAPFPLALSTESTRCLDKLLDAQKNAEGVELASDPWVDASLSAIKADSSAPQGQLKLALHGVLDDHRIDPTTSTAPPIFVRPSKVFAAPTSLVHATLAPLSSLDATVSNVQDALQALFHSEYVVMAEYIECATPVLYAVYLAFLYHLPTAEYYPHTRSLTPGKFASTEANLILYALIELALFVALNVLLKRKLGFLPLYQLAFAFETHVRTLQSHLFVWVLCILQITLVHNGKHGQIAGHRRLLTLILTLAARGRGRSGSSVQIIENKTKIED